MKTILKELIESKYTLPGVYVAVNWDKDVSRKLYEFLKDKKVPDLFDWKKYHTTLAYSRTNFNHILDKESQFEASIDKMHVFKNEKLGHTALVLKLNSDGLSKRHDMIHEDPKASYDFDEYVPHITISYDVSTMKDEDYNHIMSDKFLKELKELIPKFTNGTEYTENLDPDFTDKIKKS